MDINIYEEYDVQINYEYTTLSEENDILIDNIFIKDKNTKITKLNGGALLEEIQKRLNNNYLFEFVIINHAFYFGYFNYNTGEVEIVVIKILKEISGVDKQ